MSIDDYFKILSNKHKRGQITSEHYLQLYEQLTLWAAKSIGLTYEMIYEDNYGDEDEDEDYWDFDEGECEE